MRSYIKSRRFTVLYTIIAIIALLLLGSAMLSDFTRLRSFTNLLTILSLSVYAASALLNLLSKGKLLYLFELLLNCALIGFLSFNPNHIPIFLCRVVGGYFLLLAIIHLMVLIQFRKKRVSSLLGIFLLCAVELLISTELLIHPSRSLRSLRIFLGIYFVFYALSLLYGLLSDQPLRSGERKRRRVRIALPNVFSVFLPAKLLRRINKRLSGKSADQVLLVEKKENESADLEVFIHLAAAFPGQMGHVDICFGGTVLSYGNYDDSSYRLRGLIGDGVVEVIERQPYIDFCINYSKKTIVGFGIRTTEEQRLALVEKIASIFDSLEPWHPPAHGSEGFLFRSARYALDYASELYLSTGASFFKFRDGAYNRYRTYFSMFSNCVKMADEILSALGFDALNPVGIITPGTYYDYLNSEFLKQNSVVVSRTIYNTPSK